MTDTAKIIGSRIRSYRLQAGLSQEQLAEKAGVHPTYIGQLERAEKNATLESIEKVARALHISFDILFEKIIPGSIENDIPLQCYELIRKFEKKDQKALFRIITEIVNYKNNSR